jgi:hypothetical protein
MNVNNRSNETSADENSRFNEKLRSQGDVFVKSGRDFAAAELDRFSEVVHDASQKLYDRNDYFAQYTDGFAEKLHSASQYLREKDADNVVSSIDDFAHRHPALTVGGLLVAGFAATRWLKIGSRE